MKKLFLLLFSFVFIILISQGSKTLENTVIKSNQNQGSKESDEKHLEQKPNIDYAGYIENLRRCIHRQWKPHTGKNCHVVSTRFNILLDGTWLKNSINIISNTGEVEDKLAAENALQDASSTCIFPLPKGTPSSQVTIEFKFAKTGAMCHQQTYWKLPKLGSETT